MERIWSSLVTTFIIPFTLGAVIGLVAWTSGWLLHNIIGLGEDSAPWWGTLLGAFGVAIYSAFRLYSGLTCSKWCKIVSCCCLFVVIVVVCVAVIWEADLNEIVARLLAPLIHSPIDSDAPRLLASALLFGAITAVMSVAVDCYTSNDGFRGHHT